MLKFRTILPRLWAGDRATDIVAYTFLAPLLALASLPYRAASAARNLLYDREILKQIKLPCPVISIGNITAGGTGKTPLAILVANLLRERGYRPAILSRGYGGAGWPLCVVSDGNRILATAAIAGDEPLLIAQSLPEVPVITGADRAKTGIYAVEKLAANILVLDDAFQHRRLFRDLNIVLLRGEKPFANGHVLPWGPLREPPCALKRADILVRTSSSGEVSTMSADPRLPPLPQFQGAYHPLALRCMGEELTVSPTALQGKKICAFAGIAHPASFRETLTALGAKIVAFCTFPDHHPFSEADVADIQRAGTASGADMTVTTEKDGVRLTGHPTFLRTLFLLSVEMDILPSREEFATRITNAIPPPGQ
jgi:tetraacyldisaccharide 4'-kinase